MARGTSEGMARVAGRATASVLALAPLLVIVTLPRTSATATTWADVDPAFWLIDRAAGSGLVIAGVVAWWSQGVRRLGVPAMVAGWAWLAPELMGAATAADLWRSGAMLLAPWLLPSVLLLAVRATESDPSMTAARQVCRVLVVVVGLLALARALTYLPFDDPRCWSFCHPARNVLAVLGDGGTPVYRALTSAWGVVAAVAWSGATQWALRRLHRDRRHANPPAPVLLAGLVTLGGASVAWAAASLVHRADPPNPLGAGPSLSLVWLIRVFGIGLLAMGTGGFIVAARRRARALRETLDLIAAAPVPGGLQPALATALDDPRLTVAYVLPDGRTVDGGGVPVSPPASRPGRAVTMIVRAGDPVAVVDHDAALESTVLSAEIGAAARLAVDNERLRASVLARVAELRASQARIVTVGDQERRRLERDLHDGAQQLLLALAFEIRIALAEARRAGDRPLVDRLERAGSLATVATTELRRVAHGIHPAILRDTGLAPALATLAEDASVPLQLDIRYRGRCSDATEVAAYHVVDTVQASAARRNASHVVVRLDRVADSLIVEVEDDGSAEPQAAARTADRVGAVGGHLTADKRPEGGLRIRAVLPCA